MWYVVWSGRKGAINEKGQRCERERVRRRDVREWIRVDEGRRPVNGRSCAQWMNW